MPINVSQIDVRGPRSRSYTETYNKDGSVQARTVTEVFGQNSYQDSNASRPEEPEQPEQAKQIKVSENQAEAIFNKNFNENLLLSASIASPNNNPYLRYRQPQAVVAAYKLPDAQFLAMSTTLASVYAGMRQYNDMMVQSARAQRTPHAMAKAQKRESRVKTVFNKFLDKMGIRQVEDEKTNQMSFADANGRSATYNFVPVAYQPYLMVSPTMGVYPVSGVYPMAVYPTVALQPVSAQLVLVNGRQPSTPEQQVAQTMASLIDASKIKDFQDAQKGLEPSQFGTADMFARLNAEDLKDYSSLNPAMAKIYEDAYKAGYEQGLGDTVDMYNMGYEHGKSASKKTDEENKEDALDVPSDEGQAADVQEVEVEGPRHLREDGESPKTEDGTPEAEKGDDTLERTAETVIGTRNVSRGAHAIQESLNPSPAASEDSSRYEIEGVGLSSRDARHAAALRKLRSMKEEMESSSNNDYSKDFGDSRNESQKNSLQLAAKSADPERSAALTDMSNMSDAIEAHKASIEAVASMAI